MIVMIVINVINDQECQYWLFSAIIYHHQTPPWHHHYLHPHLACPQLLARGVAGVGPALPLVSVVLPPAPSHHVTKVKEFVLQSDLDKIILRYLAIVISYF